VEGIAVALPAPALALVEVRAAGIVAVAVPRVQAQAARARVAPEARRARQVLAAQVPRRVVRVVEAIAAMAEV
jgi:hypothetical protein